MANFFDKNGVCFSTSDKRLSEMNKYKVYCKCGHSLVFYPMEHRIKKICSWCGYYVYKDRKTEFNERLKNILVKKEVMSQ